MRKELEDFRETTLDENMVHEVSKSGKRITHKNYSKDGGPRKYFLNLHTWHLDF